MEDRVDARTLVARALDALLATAERPSTSLARMTALICESGVAEQAQVYVVDPDDVHLRLAAVACSDPAAAEALRAVLAKRAVRLDTSLAGRAAVSPDPVVLNGFRRTDPSVPPEFRELIEQFDVQHVVAVQVPGHGRTLGSLVASRTGDHPPFEPDEVRLLERVAAVSAFALDRAGLLSRVARQADILDRVSDAVVAVDENQVVTKWNRGAERLYGIDRHDALGTPLRELLTTISHASTELADAWGRLRTDDPWRDVVRQVTRDGRVVDIDASVTRLDDRESGFAGAVAVNRDISQALEHQRALAERQAFAEAVLDALPGRTVVIGTDGHVRAVNARYADEGPFGDGPGSGPDVGADILAFLDLMAHSLPGVGALATNLRDILAGSPLEQAVDVDGRDDRWTAAQTAPFRGAGGGALVTLLDVSERKALELELAYQATHDALTALPNRALLLDRLREALGRAYRREGRVAVLFVDLDELKLVNDTLGHAAGDEVIRLAATRLDRICRASDTVARIGGDEFVVLVDELPDVAEAEQLAERMLTALREPVDYPRMTERASGLSASIGVAVADGTAAPTRRDAEDLVRHADVAMLVAKRTGKGRVVLDTTPRTRTAQPGPTG